MNRQLLYSIGPRFCSHPTNIQRMACLATSLALSSLLLRPVFAQGCVPAHYISLSLGARGIDYLQPQEWQGDLSYRFLQSETVFIGTKEQPQLHALGGRNRVNSIDLRAIYGITSRFDISLPLPFEHDDFSL